MKNLRAGDGAVRGKLLAQPLVVDAVVQVLHIQIHTLEPGRRGRAHFKKDIQDFADAGGRPLHLVALDPILLDQLKLALQLPLALQPLLRPAHVDHFAVELLSVHVIDRLGRREQRLESRTGRSPQSSHDWWRTSEGKEVTVPSERPRGGRS